MTGVQCFKTIWWEKETLEGSNRSSSLNVFGFKASLSQDYVALVKCRLWDYMGVVAVLGVMLVAGVM